VKAKNRVFTVAFVFALFMLATVSLAKSQSSSTDVSVVPAQSSVQFGKTLTVSIKITDVQNLYAIDVTLDYNSSVLQLASSNTDLGTNSIPGGILYGSPVVQDTNSIESGCVYYNTTLSTANEYHLFATSVAPADSFNGSGTIATLTFNVVGTGHTSLVLNSTIADRPEPGETTSEAITHTDVSGSVDVAQIPEFPEIAMLSVLVVVATVTLVMAKKSLKKRST